MTKTEIRTRIAEMRKTGIYAGGRFGRRWQGFMPDGWLSLGQICDLADEHRHRVIKGINNHYIHREKGLEWTDKTDEFSADPRNKDWMRKLSGNPAWLSMPEEDGIRYALALIAYRRRQKTGERAPWDPEPKNTIRFEGLDIDYPTRRNVYLNGNWLCYVEIPDAVNQGARGQWEIIFPKWELHGFASEAEVKPAIAPAVAQLDWTKQEKTPEYEIDWKKGTPQPDTAPMASAATAAAGMQTLAEGLAGKSPAEVASTAYDRSTAAGQALTEEAHKQRTKVTIRAEFERRGPWRRVPESAELPTAVFRNANRKPTGPWRPACNISQNSRFQIWLDGLSVTPDQVDIDCNGVKFVAKRSRGRYIFMLSPSGRNAITSWRQK